MTRLKKPVWRKTGAHQFPQGRDRTILVGLVLPGTLAFRLKGTHTTYSLTVSQCYWLALQSFSDRAAKARKEKQRGPIH
jgi:hypothetical protein